MKIFIYAPSYDENSGGAIVLHRLCHLINQHTENKAFLIKLDPSTCGKYTLRKILSKIKWRYYSQFKFITNENWNTPVWDKNINVNASIVIYPEIISGNPLKAKNIVRWLLHQPGFHNGVVNYSSNELYFKFNSAINDFYINGSKMSDNELKIINYPIDIYNSTNISESRSIETCYLVRKGEHKTIVHDKESVKIDGLSHKEIAQIFRSSKKFICYDDYTAYSIFAVLCGCESYLVPSIGQSIEDWYPNKSDRYGISFGFSSEQRQWAETTKHKVLEHILSEHEKSIKNVIVCLSEMKEYFKIDQR